MPQSKTMQKLMHWARMPLPLRATERLKYLLLWGLAYSADNLDRLVLCFMMARFCEAGQIVETYARWALIESIVAFPMDPVTGWLTDACPPHMHHRLFQGALLLRLVSFVAMWVVGEQAGAASASFVALSLAFYQLRKMVSMQSMTSVFKLLKLRLERVALVCTESALESALGSWRSLSSSVRLSSVSAGVPGLADDPPAAAAPEGEDAEAIGEAMRGEQGLGVGIAEGFSKTPDDQENVVVSEVCVGGEFYSCAFALALLFSLVLYCRARPLFSVSALSGILFGANALQGLAEFLLSLTITRDDLCDPPRPRRQQRSPLPDSSPDSSDGSEEAPRATLGQRARRAWEAFAGEFVYLAKSRAVLNVLLHCMALRLYYLIILYPLSLLVGEDVGEGAAAAAAGAAGSSGSSEGAGADPRGVLVALVQQSCLTDLGGLLMNFGYLALLSRCPPRVYYMVAFPLLTVASMASATMLLVLRGGMSGVAQLALTSVCSAVTSVLVSYDYNLLTTIVRARSYGFVVTLYGIFGQLTTLAVTACMSFDVRLDSVIIACVAVMVVTCVHALWLLRLFWSPAVTYDADKASGACAAAASKAREAQLCVDDQHVVDLSALSDAEIDSANDANDANDEAGDDADGIDSADADDADENSVPPTPSRTPNPDDCAAAPSAMSRTPSPNADDDGDNGDGEEEVLQTEEGQTPSQ
eukprot:m51a1_g4734 hypothetical protein (700) ;mRNA; f:359748-362106